MHLLFRCLCEVLDTLEVLLIQWMTVYATQTTLWKTKLIVINALKIIIPKIHILDVFIAMHDSLYQL